VAVEGSAPPRPARSDKSGLSNRTNESAGVCSSPVSLPAFGEIPMKAV
jgi:hypothetical protein